MLTDRNSSAIVAVSDIDRARTFYRDTLGLEFVEDGMDGVMVFRTGATHLTRYMSDAVDRSVGEAEGAGATVHMPPTDIPDVGRLAFLADPQGALFYLMRGASDEDSRAFQCGERVPQGHAV